MTDIYRESQVSRGTLYRYFANREAVLDAVNTQMMSSMRATFDQAVAEHPDPVRSSRAGHRFATHPGRRSTGRQPGHRDRRRTGDVVRDERQPRQRAQRHSRPQSIRGPSSSTGID